MLLSLLADASVTDIAVGGTALVIVTALGTAWNTLQTRKAKRDQLEFDAKQIAQAAEIKAWSEKHEECERRSAAMEAKFDAKLTKCEEQHESTQLQLSEIKAAIAAKLK